MTCTRNDELLALHVEGDLAPAEAAALEEHLGACARCRTFLRELQSSQNQLKAVATDDVDLSSLAVVRERVERELRGARTRPVVASPAVWRWALAASLLASAWIVYRLATPDPGKVKTALLPPSSPPVVTASPATTAVAQVPDAHSTPRRVAKVSVREGRAPAYGLSADDADQLARALVVVAEYERAKAEQEERRAPPAPPLVRVVTANPDVVIYWQLDSNGG